MAREGEPLRGRSLCYGPCRQRGQGAQDGQQHVRMPNPGIGSLARLSPGPDPAAHRQGGP